MVFSEVLGCCEITKQNLAIHLAVPFVTTKATENQAFVEFKYPSCTVSLTALLGRIKLILDILQ